MVIQTKHLNAKTLNTTITNELVSEATHLLEGWAKKKKLLAKGKQLLVTMSITDSPLVSLKMEDKTSPDKLDELLSQPIATIKFSNRVKGHMLNGCVHIIGDLVRKTENQLLRFRNFGRKSGKEVRDELQRLGLTLDMHVPVGPREREVVLQNSFHGYVFWNAVKPLEAAGIMSVKDLLSKTEDEFVAALKDCDPKDPGYPKRTYHDMRQVLQRRGLI